jgi:acetylornithine/N-succinyldiaminopimelate aminotransferase
MDQNMVIEKGKQLFVQNYAQFPIVLNSGEGLYVKDVDGNKYLDLVAGIAVNILGYQDKGFIKAVDEVLNGGLIHCSNLYWNQYAVSAAQKLNNLSSMKRTFFCNSGTEAIEATIKLARKYGSSLKAGKTEIITMENSFHGRTMGSLSATGQPIYQKAFEPMLQGFSYAKFNDIDSVKSLLNENTCAIFVEAIQGEGGLTAADDKFLQELRVLCDQNETLLVFDEIQSGLGRTGTMFAFEQANVTADVVVLAKGLGGGIPIGAMLVAEKVSEVFVPGDHGSTFGGNLLATAAANYVLGRLEESSFIENVKQISNYFNKRLELLRTKHPQILEIKGRGLMIGLKFEKPVRTLIDLCRTKGLLVANAGPNILRIVPPLTISEKEVDEAIKILDVALNEF